MKINSKTELIFSQAVALEQSGKMKSSIHCKGEEIYIVNGDKTIILRFIIKDGTFPSEISFKANDYESSTFEMKDNKIIFITDSDGFERKKSCGLPEMDFDSVRSKYRNLKRSVLKKPANKIKLNSSILKLLDENLSHIEFYTKNKKPIIQQRDIYSGSIIQVIRKKEQLLNSKIDSINFEMKPIGLRTVDFQSLFLLNKDVEFNFYENNYCFFSGRGNSMTGFVSYCLYDEMCEIKNI
jgi:hypothetical protein